MTNKDNLRPGYKPKEYDYSMKKEWTRDDLLNQHEVWDDFVAGKDGDIFNVVDPEDLGEVLDAVVTHLNAHHPKPYPEDETPKVVWRERALEAERYLMEARRERDAAVSRADYLDKKFAKLMSDYQDIEDERDEWKVRALDAEFYAQAVSASNRDNADRASRAENARDTAATRAAQLEKKLAKVMSDYQDAEDERRESADKWHGAWQRSAPVPISSADIDRALINVTSNAMNYPNPSQMLGKDSGPLRKKCVDAVCELFGIED